MEKNSIQGRRNALKKLSLGIAAIPVLVMSGTAAAEKNAALRQALQYQDKPKDGKRCDQCSQWVPGKTPKDLGGCKVIPGDTEISPEGWCAAFAPKAPAK
jgi:hypothetical protein